MPGQTSPIRRPVNSKIFLSALAIVYLGYLAGMAYFFYPAATGPNIVDHVLPTTNGTVLQYWNINNMLHATSADETGQSANIQQQASIDTSKATQQENGQGPSNGEPFNPLSTVGKVFFTDANGRNMVCSGTATRSQNKSVVDTAGHCLYWNGAWVQNLIFCPLYHQGQTPYGCWVARDLEVPADWINAKANDLHADFGMAIAAPNSEGALTDIVGGAGWAYDQPVQQPFYAYGYPAASPHDGESRKTCESTSGTLWRHGAGNVVSIPCDMTGGSSGGPWFIQSQGNWYLDGHNDFTSSIQPGHMFSPYYNDIWYALYSKAQNT